MLGAGEDQYLAPVVLLNEVGEEIALALLVHGIDLLRHRFGSGIAPGDFDAGRVAEQAVGQGLDFRRKGGREEQVLPLLGQQREDAPNIADKAHVEHAVGLIEDENLHMRQIHAALLHMVQQSPGGGDQDIHTAAELLHLRVDLDAADEGHGAQGQIAAVDLHALFHLGGEFAGRNQDQGTDNGRAARGCRAGGRQDLQDGHGKGGGLAGARLGAGQEVHARQHNGDGLLLNGGGGGVTAFFGGTQNRFGQAEGCKRHNLLQGHRPRHKGRQSKADADQGGRPIRHASCRLRHKGRRTITECQAEYEGYDAPALPARFARAGLAPRTTTAWAEVAAKRLRHMPLSGLWLGASPHGMYPPGLDPWSPWA